MGKSKKVKAAKRKEARAVRCLSQTFAKKLGVNEVNTTSHSSLKKRNKSQDPIQIFIGDEGKHINKKTGKLDRRLRKKLQRKQRIQQQKELRGKARLSQDQIDFNQEQASLFERELARNNQTVMTWKRNKATSNVSNQSVGESSGQQKPLLQLQPPTFLLNDGDKTTSQLINETVEGFSGLKATLSSSSDSEIKIPNQPSPQQINRYHTWSSGSASSQFQRQRMFQLQQEKEKSVIDTSSSRNPFALLDDDNDDGDEDLMCRHNNNTEKTKAAENQLTSLFAFQPPTFSVSPNTALHNIQPMHNAFSNTILEEDEDDPDL